MELCLEIQKLMTKVLHRVCDISSKVYTISSLAYTIVIYRYVFVKPINYPQILSHHSGRDFT